MRSNPRSVESIRRLPIAAGLALATLGGCGGGSGATPSTSRDADSPPTLPSPPASLPPTIAPSPTDLSGADDALEGTLWLERRGDKLVADAWFRLADEAAVDASTAEALESCVLDALPSAVGGEIAATSLRMPASRIVLASRGREQLRLEPRRVGDTVVYASDERWLRDPIEADAQVFVLDANGDALYDAVAIDALVDPELASPSDGRLPTLAQPVLWTASARPGTRVRLALSALVAGEHRRVECLVEDDGRFTVPRGLVDGEATSPGWTVSIARERRERIVRGDDAFEIVQRVLF